MPARALPDPRSWPAAVPPGPTPRHCHLPRLRCERHDEMRWHGRPEWDLLFGWPGPDGPQPDANAQRAAVAAIEIDGLRPVQLQWVQVCSGSDLLYSLDTCQCANGHVASAGELVHAMASFDGRPGLSIAAADLGGERLLAGLRMRMRVHVDGAAAAALARIRVDARLR